MAGHDFFLDLWGLHSKCSSRPPEGFSRAIWRLKNALRPLDAMGNIERMYSNEVDAFSAYVDRIIEYAGQHPRQCGEYSNPRITGVIQNEEAVLSLWRVPAGYIFNYGIYELKSFVNGNEYVLNKWDIKRTISYKALSAWLCCKYKSSLSWERLILFNSVFDEHRAFTAFFMELWEYMIDLHRSEKVRNKQG